MYDVSDPTERVTPMRRQDVVEALREGRDVRVSFRAFSTFMPLPDKLTRIEATVHPDLWEVYYTDEHRREWTRVVRTDDLSVAEETE